MISKFRVCDKAIPIPTQTDAENECVDQSTSSHDSKHISVNYSKKLDTSFIPIHNPSST